MKTYTEEMLVQAYRLCTAITNGHIDNEEQFRLAFRIADRFTDPWDSIQEFHPSAEDIAKEKFANSNHSCSSYVPGYETTPKPTKIDKMIQKIKDLNPKKKDITELQVDVYYYGASDTPRTYKERLLVDSDVAQKVVKHGLTFECNTIGERRTLSIPPGFAVGRSLPEFLYGYQYKGQKRDKLGMITEPFDYTRANFKFNKKD